MCLSLPLCEKVWLSWQVSVKEASFQLSQPPPPPLIPTAAATHELYGTPIIPGSSGRGKNLDGGCDRADCTVLRLVVSETKARTGFRNEKGFFVHASVGAVEASGIGGATFFSINPAALWGQQQVVGGGGQTVWPEQPKGETHFLEAIFFT